MQSPFSLLRWFRIAMAVFALVLGALFAAGVESTDSAIVLAVPIALALTFGFHRLFGWLASLAPSGAPEKPAPARPARRQAPREAPPRLDDDPFRSPPAAPVIVVSPTVLPAPPPIVPGDPADRPKLLV